MLLWKSMPVLVVTAAALGACGHKAPQGQIAATVDGEDITDAEVQAEINASATTLDRKVALQQVIMRKVVAAYGRSNDIDKDPNLLLDQRRASENLLAARTLQSVASKIALPSDTDATKYLAAHDAWYSHREQLLVDELIFPESALAAAKIKLPESQTVNALAALLTAHKIAFSRRQVVVDTATASPIFATALAGKPVGSVTPVTLQGMRGYFEVLKQRSLPMERADAIKLIRTQLANQAKQKAVENLETTLRKQAKVDLR